MGKMNKGIQSVVRIGLLVVAVVGFATAAPAQSFGDRLSDAALERTRHQVRYVPGYVRIGYPGGDVPADTGVCTDEVIRAYRTLGIDLQQKVHEDMLRKFEQYPRAWNLSRPDTNIDHRRVPNLQTFFRRKGVVAAASTKPSDYVPGDLVSWDLGGGVPHIGIVVARRSPDGLRWLVVHNIGAGPRLEDVLFAWKITGHFRYDGS